ncbi:MAG TPA: M20/M25/M40 family metallo-hydrolase [Candidatus Limnocylindria bacterium]|nr:M20/M25/M40 family metallo-hydrolase [Candidatus Limnocylindria bacterium]
MTAVDWEAVEAAVARLQPEWTDALAEYCAIPSEASHADDLERAAQWTKERLERIGAETRVIRVAGAPPLIVGEIGPADAPVINLVQHYDVQPAGDPAEWTTPPYEPQVRDGRLYARGATDNKGEVLVRMWALDALAAAGAPVPCRVRFLVEGEEEVGSEHLDALLDTDPELRRADAALGEGGGVDEQGRPIVDCGVRGIVMIELSVRTLSKEIHSSAATLFPNAAARMAAALGTLVAPDGQPTWEGLQTGRLPLSDAARESARSWPLEWLEDYRSQFGFQRFVGGLDGADAHEADLANPTINIQGLWSGATGPVLRNVVPAEATARLDIRLVPDQDPDTIHAALREHLDASGFEDVETKRIEASERPYWSDLTHPFVDAATTAVEETFGKPAVRTQSMPGTAPMYQVCAAHGVPMVMIGGGDLHAQAHAPDESYSLATGARAALAFLRLLDNASRLPRGS